MADMARVLELTGDTIAPLSACPNCRHPLSDHDPELGCVAGWEHSREGRAVAEGCLCPMAVADQHLSVVGVDKRADGWRSR